jgi:hypothetical protein
VVSEAKLFGIVFQGNPHLVFRDQKPAAFDADGALRRVCANACRVSGAAELHQVKMPARKNSQAAPRGASQVQKRKKPGMAGLFDEYLSQSVHFASLAI